MANTYAAGNTIRILASFINSSGTAYNPGSVTVQVLGPNSRQPQTPAVVNDSTGNYHADVVASDPGLWLYRITGTNPSSAAEGRFEVPPSQFVA